MKSSSLDAVSKALTALNEVYQKDEKLATIMTAPTLSAEDKSQIIAELQKHTGATDKSNTVKHFLETLAENNRLSLLKGVCEKFVELMGAARGEVELTITSATVRIPVHFRQLSTDIVTGFGQQNPFTLGICRSKVAVQQWKKAQGYEQSKSALLFHGPFSDFSV